MGWQEYPENDDNFQPLTEDELREFQAKTEQVWEMYTLLFNVYSWFKLKRILHIYSSFPLCLTICVFALR